MEWEQRVAALWAAADQYDDAAFRAAMTGLVAELPEDDPVRYFELGSAYDSTGDPARAVDNYRRALELGLDGSRRRQAVIQLASSLRNLGQAAESVALLTVERDAGKDELDDAVDAFLALALTSVGRDREAVAVALTALAPHLARYTRALTAYAAELPRDGAELPAGAAKLPRDGTELRGAERAGAERADGGTPPAPGMAMSPVGRVESPLTDRASAPRQGDEGAPEATIVLQEQLAAAYADIAPGDELIVLTWLDRADRGVLAVHPRDDTSRPLTGVFSTRAPDRPNPIGLHRVTVLAVDGPRLRVAGLEALDGTPVVDLKPVLGRVEER